MGIVNISLDHAIFPLYSSHIMKENGSGYEYGVDLPGYQFRYTNEIDEGKKSSILLALPPRHQGMAIMS